MTFNIEIQEFKRRLEELKSIGQLRECLLENDLHLVLTVCTPKVSFLDWDITQKKICGILHLGMNLRISRIFSKDVLLETRIPSSITFDHYEWKGQSELFEVLKTGITNCLNKIC